MTFSLLSDVRVVDVSVGISGGYATKLLRDAGADVVKVETVDGDPLRRWAASDVDLHDSDGVLFQFLARGKRSVIGEPGDRAIDMLLSRADLVVESGQLSMESIRLLRKMRPSLSIVSITPFGRTGPWADRPGTDFTLQGWSGSLAFRGLPEREPLQIGGRVPEWLAGTFAACGALGALAGSRRSGHGDHVDVSILETMIGRFGAGSLLAPMARDSQPSSSPGVPSRTLEFPSIEKTSDGYVAVCPNTAQNFSDLLVMIGRADLADDRDLASFAGRWRRRDELRGILASWFTVRTTAVVLEQASLFRVPAAPVAAPDTIAGIDHFVERGVLVRDPDGGYLAPRIPFQFDGIARSAEGAAPRLGEHTGSIGWEASPTSGPRIARDALPLSGLRVIDFTSFWAGPIAAQLLASLGADVIKLESVQRPDGFRFIRMESGPLPDDWWERSNGYQMVNTNKRGITLDLAAEEGRDLLLALAEHADVFVENYAPRVLGNLGITVEQLHERNPSIIAVRMPGFGLRGPWRDWTAFASTIEAASGMAWRCGYADGPPITLRGPADPIAGLHAGFAILAALHARERGEQVRFIEASMIEAGLNVAAESLLEHSAYGRSLSREGNRGPGAPQGLFACRGEERWLAIAVVDDEQWAGLRKAIGDPPWARAPELDSTRGRRRAHDELDRHLAAWAATQDLDSAVAALVDYGVPVSAVVSGESLRDNEHLRARRYYEPLGSPILADHVISSLPVRFSSRAAPWTRRPAPTLGEHNHEVLGDLLGLDGEQIAGLEARHVVGTRPLGL